ncbi:MAG: hypothetical protein ABL997_01215 [Planctomycetota bacterium]
MRTLLQTLWMVLASLLLALSGRGDSGGGGDSGVWILPLASNVSGLPSVDQENTGAPRDWRLAVPSLGPLKMQVSADVGQAFAVLYESDTGLQLPIMVSGRCIMIPARTQEALLASSSLGKAMGSIADASGRGYLLRIRRSAAGELLVEIL